MQLAEVPDGVPGGDGEVQGGEGGVEGGDVGLRQGRDQTAAEDEESGEGEEKKIESLFLFIIKLFLKHLC